ncbi:LysE family translocator [Sinorhizobium psoraleae]|nr:LysE family transporter [Sinorhizobium psoraleae]
MPIDAAYRRGLLVVLTNPKAALMWAAISMFLGSSQLGLLEFLAIGVGASMSAVVVYGAYALLFSTGVALRGYRRFFRMVDGTFGIVFGALGGRLLWDGVKHLTGLRA